MRSTVPDPPEGPVAAARRDAALVACIGNELVADDAAGCEVYERLLAMELPPGARVEFAGVGGIALLDRLRGDERALIVVDAVRFGAAAGTIHCLPWDKVPASGGAAISAHGIGLKETIEIGRMLYPERMPPEVLLVGIEGRCFDRMRSEMTPETEAAVGEAAGLVRERLVTYLQER